MRKQAATAGSVVPPGKRGTQVAEVQKASPHYSKITSLPGPSSRRCGLTCARDS